MQSIDSKSEERGTIQFMSTEILNDKETKAEKHIYVWSSGVCIYYLLKKQFPSPVKLQKDLYESIQSTDPFPIGMNISSNLEKLLMLILDENQNRTGFSICLSCSRKTFYVRKYYSNERVSR
jgi:hypothetical protein